MAWQKLQPAKPVEKTEEELGILADHLGVPIEEARRLCRRELDAADWWMNDLYTVVMRRQAGPPDWPDLVHLSIRRNDRAPARDWRDFQRIKNELVGPECEGIELYPAESRRVDSANQYHLWVLDAPGTRLPIAFQERLVDARSAAGAVQRPFDEEETSDG